jgi:hypothetical protein
MKQYIGTSICTAVAMTLGDYNKHRNWDIPENEDPNAEGYLITRNDTTLTWSPREVFEEAYRTTDGMTFGLAIEAMKKGLKVARAGWNGRGMFIRLVGTTAELNAHFEIFNVHGRYDTWVASVSDSLADGWTVVE